ncbi:oxysterol-binding protein 1 isoform X2 [Epargyreus clarus]|uniref:oxysterol-binding protein 1 isoform X2 n=1 Tax=Epargyreus clarus TaxID=520877 RepID=UPI003C2EA388
MSDVIVPKGQPVAGDPEKKGWLFKWTNYLKGYQRRWFVLSNGLLSYYRNQAEMAHTCRGTISLLGALIHTADSCTFVISNGGTQTFHIRAHDEVERQSWVTALELAKAKAMLVRAQESDDDEDQISGGVVVVGSGDGEGEDAGGIARELAARFHDLRTCSELVARHGAALQRSLVDLEIPPSDTTNQVSERATLFRISCNAMMNACSEFMSTAAASSARLSRALQHEREQKIRLQEVVEQLARQHDSLEKTAMGQNTSHSGGNGSGQGNETEDEDHEFFDAVEEGVTSTMDDKTSFVIKVPVNRKNKEKSGESSDESEGETVTETQQVIFVEDQERAEGSMGGAEPGEDAAAASKAPGKEQDIVVWPHVSQAAGGRARRTRVPDKPNYPLSLWSIMKNCIGKELSKIPIPVNFSEPLSMLQRLTEDYEYSMILDQAAKFTDPAQQLAYVAAFTVSSYATTACRTNKPFNPLLGETFECDRMADLGWRSISEQVLHHPPTSALHCEGGAWHCAQQVAVSSRFRGQFISIDPDALCCVLFKASGSTYYWTKVSTTVHNIIVGKLWVDNHGDMDIKGEAGPAAGYVAHVKYLPYGYFSKDTQRKVTGVVKDPQGVPRYVLQGHWDSRVEVAPVTSASADNTVCKTGKFVLAWERVPAPPDSDRWYNFTLLAAQLNEPEEGVAPTDSRLRPDQRLMEEGLWDEANVEKLRLEEKQRGARRQLEAAAEAAAARGLPAPAPAPRPAWFARQAAPAHAHLRHLYTHRYWDCKARQDWAACPDIF